VADNSASPKTYVSHASEDHERFVLGFATKLRQHGINAWVDEWEIAPGDSLVDRIFEEGIGGAEAVIVVLSKNSVNKPWVREELNSATIQRINKKSKLIPVLIDDCEDELPVAVRHLAWRRISDLNEYDADVDRIVMAIHGQLEKPPLGEAPPYVRLSIDVIPGLDGAESLVLESACEMTIERDDERLAAREVADALDGVEFPSEQVPKSIEILDRNGYIEIKRLMMGGSKNYPFKVTWLGMEEYLRVCMPDYDEVFRAVISRLVNHGDSQSVDIIEALEQPRVVVDHVLDSLEQKGYVRSQIVTGGNRFIFDLSPELERVLIAVGSV
jgi:TIR domain